MTIFLKGYQGSAGGIELDRRNVGDRENGKNRVKIKVDSNRFKLRPTKVQQDESLGSTSLYISLFSQIIN